MNKFENEKKQHLQHEGKRMKGHLLNLNVHHMIFLFYYKIVFYYKIRSEVREPGQIYEILTTHPKLSVPLQT